MVEQERVAAVRAQSEEAVEIWPEHRPALNLFMACRTQWRTTMHGRLGLDYLAMDWVARRMDLEVDAALLDDIQVMEDAALGCWDEQRQRTERQ